MQGMIRFIFAHGDDDNDVVFDDGDDDDDDDVDADEEDDDADGGVGDKDQYKHQAPIANMFTCTDKLNLPELTCPHPTSHP